MKLDSSRLPALLDDLDAAMAEMKNALGGDPAAWTRAPEGKWSAGQHVEHVALNLEMMVEPFERNVEALRAGALGPPPRRGLFEAFVIRMFMREPFPKGGKSPKFTRPGPTPSREAAFQRLTDGAARYRALHDRLTPEERERIWIINPYMATRGWHYRLFENVRVQTTHARHHMRLAVQAARS